MARRPFVPIQTIQDDLLYSTSEAADYLGCAVSLIIRYCGQKKLSYQKIGNDFYVFGISLRRYKEANLFIADADRAYFDKYPIPAEIA